MLDGLDVLHRRRGADRRGARRRRRRARSRGSRRRSPRSSSRRCGAATRPRPASCGRSSSASRAIAALKAVAVARGVPMREDVRAAAARRSRDAERRELLARGPALGELVDRLPRARVHVGAALVDVVRSSTARRGSLGSRLLDAARLGELRLQLVGRRRVGCAGRRAPAAQERAQTERAGAAAQAGASRRPMLHCRRFSPRPSRRHPKRRQGGGADSVHEKGGIRALNEYEIMLLLDPELAEERGERDHPAHPRRRRGRGRHLGRPRAVGPPAPRLRDRPQGRGGLPPAALHGAARDARRDHARPQDHRRRHAPLAVRRVKGGHTKAPSPRRRCRPRPPRPRPRPPMTATRRPSSLGSS